MQYKVNSNWVYITWIGSRALLLQSQAHTVLSTEAEKITVDSSLNITAFTKPDIKWNIKVYLYERHSARNDQDIQKSHIINPALILFKLNYEHIQMLQRL